MQQQEAGSFMDMDYEYEAPEQDGGHRPQSRASQHSSRPVDSNGHSSQNVANYRRTQPRNQNQNHYERQEVSPYDCQQSQFDEPKRRGDDDMW